MAQRTQTLGFIVTIKPDILNVLCEVKDDLPNPGIEPRSPTLQADSLPAEPQGSPRILAWKPILSPVDLPDPGIKAGSPALQADSLPTELSEKPISI